MSADGDLRALWSPAVHALKPYVPGEQCNDPAWVKLNTNELAEGPSPRALEAIRAHATERLRLYPDPGATALREAVAQLHGIEAGEVFVGNGSDEVLAHAFAAFLRHGRPVLMPDVTYNFYASYCLLFGIECVRVPLSPAFEIDVRDYARPNGGIVIANPNAPTGRFLPLEHLDALARAHPSSAIIVDEAYVDFGGESAVALIRERPNVLVVQTLSKSRGLAALRVGFAMGNAALVEALERVKNSFNSYPLGHLAIVGATAALRDAEHFARVREDTMIARDELVAGLAGLGFETVPSLANFVFTTHPRHDARDILARLRERRILVRHFDQPRTHRHLRISVGHRAQHEALLAALSEIVGAPRGA